MDIIYIYILPSVFPSSASLRTDCFVNPQMFSMGNADRHVFWCKCHHTPYCYNNEKEFTLETGCCFDSCLEEAYLTKLVKYQSLVREISGSGYKCQFLVFISGSLGHVHTLVTRGPRIVGFSKMKPKQLARYCSISSIIGSGHIWRRRCCVHPMRFVVLLYNYCWLSHMFESCLSN